MLPWPNPPVLYDFLVSLWRWHSLFVICSLLKILFCLGAVTYELLMQHIWANFHKYDHSGSHSVEPPVSIELNGYDHHGYW